LILVQDLAQKAKTFDFALIKKNGQEGFLYFEQNFWIKLSSCNVNHMIETCYHDFRTKEVKTEP